MPAADVSVTAHFKQADYKVTLNANGGTVNEGDVTGYVYGEGAKVPTNVTSDGYTFGGWYDNASFTGSRVTAITGTDTGDKTYWAKWTAIPGSAPVFTLPDGPKEVAVRPGERATLTAAATNATAWQWYVNRNDGQSYVKLSGATDTTYTTSAVTLDNDGYTYYCEAANAYGTGNSPVFTLRVSEAAGTLPQTGDHSHTGLWLALMLSRCGLLLLVLTGTGKAGSGKPPCGNTKCCHNRNSAHAGISFPGMGAFYPSHGLAGASEVEQRERDKDHAQGQSLTAAEPLVKEKNA